MTLSTWLAVALAVINPIWLALALALVGKRTPRFDHRRHTISELGQIGAPFERVMSYAVFFPIGIGCMLLSVWFIARSIDGTKFMAAAALAACVGISYVVSALFPTTHVRSPGELSLGQRLHWAGAGLQYIGGGVAILSAVPTIKMPWSGLALVSFALVWSLPLGFKVPWLKPRRGLIQRAGDFSQFIALAIFALAAALG